jgi:hypothetical protein
MPLFHRDFIIAPQNPEKIPAGQFFPFTAYSPATGHRLPSSADLRPAPQAKAQALARSPLKASRRA